MAFVVLGAVLAGMIAAASVPRWTSCHAAASVRVPCAGPRDQTSCEARGCCYLGNECFHRSAKATVLMHYMPWFSLEAQDFHWTMQLFEKDNLYLYDRYLQKGKVAAHYTPLIGPYSSTDTDTIRLHLQLMKLSGISGVIVNWYGVYSGALLEASNLVIQEASRAGMMWSVCYEDWTIPDNAPDPVQKQLLHEDFRYLRDQYFKLPGLLRESEGGAKGRPVIFVFGPKRFYSREVWINMLEIVFSGFTDRPLLQGADRLNPTAILDGKFAWPGWDLFTTPNDPPTVANSKQFAERFYSSAKRNDWKPVVGVVYPRFRDFYVDGSVPGSAPSWGGLHLPSFNEETLWSTIIAANKSDPHFVQAATWNDFQEGTVFEPTAEDGFLFLSVLQQALLGIEDEASLRDAVLQYNRLKRQSWQCDNVPYEFRNDCGDLSTTKTSCEDAGCCWRPTAQNGRPNCFHRQLAQACTCASHLRDCDTRPEDRLCCCKHDAHTPPNWTAVQNCTAPYLMCGVPGHRGPTCCKHGYTCRLKNESWAQCVPA